MDNYRITPEEITDVEQNEVFVFGSNLRGIHGAGAAQAALKFGAVMGRGIGLSGRTYALPTKDEKIQSMSLEDIQAHVNDFYEFVRANPQLHFLVTKVGCGLAGNEPTAIALLFGKRFTKLENCSLPAEFRKAIGAQCP